MGLHSTKNTVYSNCSIYHPDGTLMCRCSHKKINWYLKRGLATSLSDTEIQLKFTPKGKGHHLEEYYLEDRVNHCVVCGVKDNLTKHHVVPYQYRKHMDTLKNHSHFDVLCICTECHTKYETQANLLNKSLMLRYNIQHSKPLTTEEKLLVKVKSYVEAIKSSKATIPKVRLDSMFEFVSKSLGMEVSLSNVHEIHVKLPDMQPLEPGKMVLDKWLNNSMCSLKDFIVMWRKHFIETTSPKFLSELWIKNSEL
jgi:hypothetical protein